MSPIIVTLAQFGGYTAPRAVAPAPAVVPPAPSRGAVTIPDARQPSHAGAYFMLFKLCSCGHSSAWHSGAFGAAWRAGEQVEGRCEAADDLSSATCGCTGFRPVR